MSPVEQAKAYQGFFYKSEAGKQFIEWLQGSESSHISKAQRTSDLNELNRSAGNKEVLEHIDTLIGQAADQ